jgi:A/G-specific adenine glycosylase
VLHPESTTLPAAVLRTALARWFSAHGRTLPWRTNPSPYGVLVSEFMLQQTQVATVIPFFSRWMERFPDLPTLAEAAEDEVLRLWQGLGYYSRARNLHRAAKLVVDRFGGALPSDPALLASLPGVGPYAAGAIACFAFDRAAPAVDANIARVLARLANVRLPIDSPAGNRLIWALASALLPEKSGGRLHTSALMELGALVCLPKKPQCLVCPVHSHCRAQEPENLPKKAPRKPTIQRMEDASWILSEKGILLERQTGRRSGGLWSLPKLEVLPPTEPLFQTVYPFTHHRVTLRVHAAPPPAVLSAEQRWFAPDQILDEAALPAGHRRAVAALLGTQMAAQSAASRSEPMRAIPPATVTQQTSPLL